MDALKRLLSKVKVLKNGCWEYTGGCFDDGYGAFWLDGKTVRANRSSMRLHGMELDDDQHALHTCDYRRCVNPEHLYAGTHQNNMDDLKSRGGAKGIPKSDAWKAKARQVDQEKRRQAAIARWSRRNEQ